jgi:hypothetical protein
MACYFVPHTPITAKTLDKDNLRSITVNIKRNKKGYKHGCD